MGENYVIFRDWQVHDLGFPGWIPEQKFWNPTTHDVALFEDGLRKALEDAIAHPELFDSAEAKKILNLLPEYRRQIFGVIVDGERRLYVSFLPGAKWNEFGDNFSAWKTQTYAVSDGGFWFWSIQFSPKSGVYSQLNSHGYA